ncbi:hypothetical protein GGR53DRAFT_4295 [Hypoxylon sp. FL1150]|nr:hypothetical protein GGR53DRAFT_4295 [Hypoxylon sp. FL1150]
MPAGAQFLEGEELFSFAWCGWMGEKGTGGRAIYDEDVLKGCLSNIGQWVGHHTWIDWCLRDEKGHLRPLGGNITRGRGRAAFDEDRWNGYSRSEYQGAKIEESMMAFGTKPMARGITRELSPPKA